MIMAMSKILKHLNSKYLQVLGGTIIKKWSSMCIIFNYIQIILSNFFEVFIKEYCYCSKLKYHTVYSVKYSLSIRMWHSVSQQARPGPAIDTMDTRSTYLGTL